MGFLFLLQLFKPIHRINPLSRDFPNWVFSDSSKREERGHFYQNPNWVVKEFTNIYINLINKKRENSPYMDQRSRIREQHRQDFLKPHKGNRQKSKTTSHNRIRRKKSRQTDTVGIGYEKGSDGGTPVADPHEHASIAEFEKLCHFLLLLLSLSSKIQNSD